MDNQKAFPHEQGHESEGLKGVNMVKTTITTTWYRKWSLLLFS
ncbi:Hypothetical protein LUCI_1351 [Lucifera butyrica]|uniref:Uncharacterized protein n=1 Tax=Lucifera butyrica TaxID=1351585 RepID=A0A498R0S2_9FIRM|nr:hypothetical protein [Lucifera butyrica]VBB06136.1 Hypothetical protein LUCI_1351 [Lucifera butyrica]